MSDNPPAFPVADVRTHDGLGLREGSDGMTLRDWFAGQALSLISADDALRANGAGSPAKFIAGLAYELADAMLAERSKP